MFSKNLKNHVARFFFEFLVVVSGVLVAYTINNASQATKDRKAEKALLNSIYDDLKADSLSLKNMVDFNNVKIKWIHKVIQKIRDKRVSADSVATYSSSLGSFNFFKSQRFNY